MSDVLAPGTTDKLISAPSYEPRRAAYALIVVQISWILFTLDSAISTVLVKPIEAAMRVGDVGFATISDTPGAIALSLTFFPGGVLADTFRRRDMMLVGTIVGIIASVMAARAESPWFFALSRFLISLGFGLWTTSMFSLMGDVSTSTQRGWVMGTWVTLFSIIQNLALIVGGWIAATTRSWGSTTVLGIAAAPWQQCFWIVAALGVLGLGLILTLREPPRRQIAPQEAVGLVSNIGSFASFIRRHVWAWIPLILATAMLSTGSIAISTWGPALGMRRFGATDVGSLALLSAITATGTLVGSAAGGALAQRATRSGASHKLPGLSAAVCWAGGVFSFGFPYMPTWAGVVAGIGLTGAATTAASLIYLVAMEEGAPNRARGQLDGLSGMLSFVPLIIGPTLVAFLAEHMFSRSGGLGPALSWVCGTTSIFAGFLYLVGGRRFIHAVSEARSGTAGAKP